MNISNNTTEVSRYEDFSAQTSKSRLADQSRYLNVSRSYVTQLTLVLSGGGVISIHGGRGVKVVRPKSRRVTIVQIQGVDAHSTLKSACINITEIIRCPRTPENSFPEFAENREFTLKRSYRILLDKIHVHKYSG